MNEQTMLLALAALIALVVIFVRGSWGGPMSIEARELHDLRVGQYMRAGYDAAAASFEAGPVTAAERARADYDPGDDIPTRRGVCLCCGERREIPLMWHVCLSCHQELEEERC